MKSKLQVIALSIVSVLLLTACPGPEPEPQPNPTGTTQLSPDNNSYVHQYNVAQSLLGKSKGEAEAVLLKEGYDADTIGNGVYNNRETNEDGSLNDNRILTIKASASGKVYYVKSQRIYYGPKPTPSVGYKDANVLVKAFGEKHAFANGVELEFTKFVDYNGQQAITDFAEVNTFMDAMAFENGAVVYNDLGYTILWGDGDITYCDANKMDIDADAQAGTINAFAFYNLESKMQDDDLSSTNLIMVLAAKDYAK